MSRRGHSPVVNATVLAYTTQRNKSALAVQSARATDAAEQKPWKALVMICAGTSLKGMLAAVLGIVGVAVAGCATSAPTAGSANTPSKNLDLEAPSNSGTRVLPNGILQPAPGE
jgi:hypothetical protein